MSSSAGALGEVFTMPRVEDCGSEAELFAAVRNHERLEAVQLSRKAELVAAISEQIAQTDAQQASPELFPFSLRQKTVQELSAALGASSYKAGDFIDFAENMTKFYPKLGALLAKAGITANTARHVHAALKQIPVHLRVQMDDWLEVQAPKWRLYSEGKIQGLIEARIIRLDADWAKEQREERERKQGVFFTPVGSGMAKMWGVMPLLEAAAVKDALDQIAGTACEKDPRKPWVRRKDALLALATSVTEEDRLRCACGDPECEGADHPAPQAKPLTLIVGLEVLANLSDLPAWLDGSPIDPDLARKLAAAASRIKFTADPEHYAPTAAVITHVNTRDSHCRFPGCHRKTRTDLDHTIPFNHNNPSSGGLTVPSNLKKLCRKHHLAKTHTGWQDQQLPDGTVHWLSPFGQRYTTRLDIT